MPATKTLVGSIMKNGGDYSLVCNGGSFVFRSPADCRAQVRRQIPQAQLAYEDVDSIRTLIYIVEGHVASPGIPGIQNGWRADYAIPNKQGKVSSILPYKGAYQLFQEDIAYAPGYLATGVGGKAGLSFDASAYMMGPSGLAGMFGQGSTVQEWSVAYVGQFAAPRGDTFLFTATDATVSGQLSLIPRTFTGEQTLYRNEGGRAETLTTGAGLVTFGVHAFVLSYSGTNAVFMQDGVQLADIASTALGQTLDTFVFGAGPAGASAIFAQVGEFAISNRAVTLAQCQDFFAYARSYYGTP